MVIEAFFRTATDARFAISALRRIGAEPSDPIPVRPNDGRPFRVDIDLETGSMAQRYSKPVLVNEVVGLVLKSNGITDQVDRVVQ